MHSLLVGVLLVVVVPLVPAAAACAAETFDEWMECYNIKYPDTVDRNAKQDAFGQSKQAAAEMQDKNPKATFGVGPYADWTQEEFSVKHGLEAPSRTPGETLFPKDMAAKYRDRNIDFRSDGYVAEVSDQGRCGAGWAFATAGCIEGQRAKAGWPLETLSAEELVRCDFMNSGCKGGLVDEALTWVVENGGLHTADEYPYTAGDNPDSSVRCTRKKLPSAKATAMGIIVLPSSEDEMLVALARFGPFAAYIEASGLQHYKEGIISYCGESTGSSNQAVTVVGYGSTDGTRYWIVKNSWGGSWGEGGYARIEFGKEACGISRYPSMAMVPMEPRAEKELQRRLAAGEEL